MTSNLKIHKFNPATMENRRIKGSPPTCVFIGKRGSGKCLGRDTPILMYDGSIKMVQDVHIGDVIMGDDSCPRNVLALSSGESEMYKVIQTKGDDYIVNENHVLSLKIVKTNTVGKSINLFGKKFYRGDVLDVPIQEYLKLSKTTMNANLKGYKVPIDFPEKEIPFDPYLLGLWLGDGTSATSEITNQDSTILKYLSSKLPEYECYLKFSGSKVSKKYCYRICGKLHKKGQNTFLNFLKTYSLLNNKHIPDIYKINSRKNQLKLLAGILDTDGYLDYKTKNVYEITQKNYKLASDIKFIAQSLGFMCNIKNCIKSSQNGKKGVYYRMCISGNGIDEIPCLIPRKIAVPYAHNKNNLYTGISIEPLGVDNYYGFEVDGNHRFLLGDFTVTHNSTLISDIMYYHRTVPYGVIMSGTEDGNGFYGQYFPDLFIHSEFKSEALEKLIKQQKKCVKEETDPKRGHVFLLIDDLMYDKKMIRDKNMRQIFMNGRHWRILFFLSMQYCMDLPPDMRTNIDFVFLLRENIVANQMKLWKNFCGIFPTFQSFQETFTACTENYECLVLDNTSKSNKIEDCVFWYKGVQNREYRIGSKQLWDFAKTHYNKNYDKEENESAVNDPIKKQNGLNIIKKGNKADVK